MLLSVLSLTYAAFALASPLKDLRATAVDTSVYCGQWDTISTGIEYRWVMSS